MTGYGALYRNTTGGYNSAVGYFALGYNTVGVNNIAVGPYAGYNLTTGSNNIDIGNSGVAGSHPLALCSALSIISIKSSIGRTSPKVPSAAGVSALTKDFCRTRKKV